MPHSQTILWAISVACSMSLPAPVVMLAEDDLLGDAAAEGDGDVALRLLLGEVVPVVLGQVPGDAERGTARDDGDLVDRIVVA